MCKNGYEYFEMTFPHIWMAGQGATNVSVAEQQLSTKIHGKFNDVLKEVLVGLIKPHVESRKMHIQGNKNPSFTVKKECHQARFDSTEVYTKIDQIKIQWYDHRFILGHQK